MRMIDSFSFDFLGIVMFLLERHLILNYQGKLERDMLASSIIVGSDDNSHVLVTELN
jgi:hypothetical protein